jgi:hypothetical protein
LGSDDVPVVSELLQLTYVAAPLDQDGGLLFKSHECLIANLLTPVFDIAANPEALRLISKYAPVPIDPYPILPNDVLPVC